ncbi:Xaa-Pro peptidase family protein [Salarchaeum sp. JOR-1]|uniref:M24 family metallopeptidase n=1 Tax=Salarchaeum sp. JOR-1 TaxID=2599399 RepID=UPI0011984540|nr:Xaa-Pro peptidase family protein [Salarchaeum sp. JOR-1]QDX39593.1 aminopeptidase P family protein [Salarchaeum sp. JOR-1]
MTPFERRTRDCQDRLDADEALALFPSPNLYYLGGFHESPGERHFFLFVTPDDAAFLAPALYAEQLRDETWVDDVRTWRDGDDPVEHVRDVAADLDLGSSVLLDETMWARFSMDLRTALPDAEFGLATDVLSALRVRKDDAERDAIRRASEAADAAMRDVRALGADAVGSTETDLARYVADRLEHHGGTGTSFETIVASGPNAALPHHQHGEREIRPGEPVVFDFGTRVDRYPSDQTRTVVFEGEPPEAYIDAHEAVADAQQAAVDAVEPGVSCEAVDAAAREVVADAGFGEEFVHRTGHGVGLDVHEEPYIVGGNERELREGMVFSVEPGVYRAGEWGVRIEDLVAVTADGCERLNHTTRDWRP